VLKIYTFLEASDDYRVWLDITDVLDMYCTVHSSVPRLMRTSDDNCHWGCVSKFLLLLWCPYF